MLIIKHVDQLEEIMEVKKVKCPKFWSTQAEIKEMLKIKQEQDEQEVMKILAERSEKPSKACKILIEWGLNRKKVKTILKSLDRERKLQTTFSNLIGATRFKTIVEGQLMAAVCPKCGREPDDWQHHKECYNLAIPKDRESKDKEKWLALIKKYMEEITTPTPAKSQASSIPYKW